MPAGQGDQVQDGVGDQVQDLHGPEVQRDLHGGAEAGLQGSPGKSLPH